MQDLKCSTRIVLGTLEWIRYRTTHRCLDKGKGREIVQRGEDQIAIVPEPGGQAGHEEKGWPPQGGVEKGEDKQRWVPIDGAVRADGRQTKGFRADDHFAVVFYTLIRVDQLEQSPADFQRPAR